MGLRNYDILIITLIVNIELFSLTNTIADIITVQKNKDFAGESFKIAFERVIVQYLSKRIKYITR